MYSRRFRDWILSLKLMSHVKRTWQAYSSVITVSIKIPTWFRKISPLIGINKTIWSRFHDCNALIGSLRLICEINTRSLNRHVVKYEFVENEWWKSCQEDLELSSGAFYHHAPDRKFHCIQTVPGRFITTKWHGIFDKTTTGRPQGFTTKLRFLKAFKLQSVL